MKVKKIVCMILAMVMMCTTLMSSKISLSSVSATEVEAMEIGGAVSGDYQYKVLNDGTAEITKYTGSAIKVTIPSKINGYSVTSIGNDAFADCTSLTNVTIPNSVTSVGTFCFDSCTKLQNVKLSENLTYISKGMFDGCTSLKSINLPNKVIKICDSSFSTCIELSKINLTKVKIICDDAFSFCESLRSVKFSDTLIKIGKRAFYFTGLKTIDLPKNVKEICFDAGTITNPDSFPVINSSFGECTNLKSITVNKSNKYFSSKNGVLYNKKKTILLQYPCNGKKSFSIPKSVQKIGKGAFAYSKIENVNICDNVKTIETCAFSNCKNLIAIKLNKKIREIPDGAFAHCVNLQNIYFSKNITKIGKRAFCFCITLAQGTKGIKIPDSVKTIGDRAFDKCTSIKKIVLSKNLKSLGSGAFINCDSAKAVTVYKSTKNIGNYALGYCEDYFNGSYYDFSECKYKKVKKFTIAGSKGSSAEKYAKKNGFKFKVL